MIGKFIKALANPQGLLVQVLIEQFAKIFKSQKVLEYVEMENELDKSVKRIDKTLETVTMGQEAMKSVFKGFQDQIDLINKMAHPTKEFTKDIDRIKNEITDIKSKVGGFTSIINKMKKISLLKSIFK